MSRITITVKDSALKASSDQITTGSFGTVPCVFDFDSSWDGYSITGIFYQDEENMEYVVLGTSVKECDTPFNVLLAEKPLYIGVFGTKDNLTKTTDFGYVELIEGAYKPGIVPPPSPDTYVQMLNLIEANADNAAAALVSQQAAKTSEVNAKASETAAQDIKNDIDTAEPQRVAAENGRISAENARKTAENSRNTAEENRNIDEIIRSNNENDRTTAETNRANAENTRATNESNRVAAENGRSNAENNRVTAESNRVTAENNRQTFYDNFGDYISSLNRSIGCGIVYGGEVTATVPPSRSVNISALKAIMPDGTVYIKPDTVFEIPYPVSQNIGILCINKDGNFIVNYPPIDKPDDFPIVPDGASLLYKYIFSESISQNDLTDMRIFAFDSNKLNEDLDNIKDDVTANTQSANANAQNINTNTQNITANEQSIQTNEQNTTSALTSAAKNTAEIKDMQNTLTNLNLTGAERLEQNTASDVVSLPINTAEGGIKGIVRGMTLTNLVNGKGIAASSTVTFDSVLNNKYYDSLHKTILTGTGSSITVTNDTDTYADIMIIDMSALGLEDKTAEEIDMLAPKYFDGTQHNAVTRLRSVPTDGINKALYIEPYEHKRLPNGVCDITDLSTGKRIQRVKPYTLQESDIANLYLSYNNIDIVLINKNVDFIGYNTGDRLTGQIYFPGYPNGPTFNDDMQYIGKVVNTNPTQYGLIVAKGTYANLAEAQADFVGTEILYQLAEPIITKNVTSGVLQSYPNGTIYAEHALLDVGFYKGDFEITRTKYPIKKLEALFKVNQETGAETPLDVSNAVIAEDNLTLTHPDLSDGDLVDCSYFFEYGGVNGINTYSYLDSNIVKLDSGDGKFKKLDWSVNNGDITFAVTEV